MSIARSLRAGVASACLVGLLLTSCGPNTAVHVDAGPSVTATTNCSPIPLATVTGVRVQPAAASTAVLRVTSVVVAQVQPGAAAARTSVPREELVTQAVATATAQAQLPRTATATPQPTPSRPPITYSMCVSPTGSPGARLIAVVVTPRPRPIAPAIAVAPIASPSVTLQNPRVLLATDASSEVVLQVGDRLVLLLGDYGGGTDWQVQLSDPAILRKVADDGEGVYEAASTGETQLNAVGSPACLNSAPRCAAPTRLLRYAIRVL